MRKQRALRCPRCLDAQHVEAMSGAVHLGERRGFRREPPRRILRCTNCGYEWAATHPAAMDLPAPAHALAHPVIGGHAQVMGRLNIHVFQPGKER